MNLIIVESPTKSKTIQKFLGKDYKAVSSFGHVRDLPKTKLGVDIENNFEPQYVSVPKASKTIKEIEKLAKKAETVYLATDPDREGEAISWHISETIKIPKEKYKRIAFHEITDSAIKESINSPREIDFNLVNAQQARRILDRIVGYKLSPLLWKKITRGLSAGRVQSVALKFIVDREREIDKFQKEEYWTIKACLENKKDEARFSADLIEINEKKVSKFSFKNKEETESIEKILEKQNYFVSDIKEKESKRNPLPPFITSTLQQEAYKKLRFSSKMTMRLAQQLYEKGFSTYHRTDSFNLSNEAVNQAKIFVENNYGKNYWKGTLYKSKSKGAQEAHEAVRPSRPEISPEKIKNELDRRQLALYDLIWKRFMASLMSPAIVIQATLEIETKPEKFKLKTNGQLLKFDGFLKVYPIKMEEKSLPKINVSDNLSLIKIMSEQHFTQPPARYTEATLIKILEEKGIGRPSTYAPTLSVIQERNYVEKTEDKKFKPTEIGIVVSDLLSNHFSTIVDADFTAEMEKSLDEIAEGKKDWKNVLESFYKPFNDLLATKEKEIDKKKITEKETNEICDKCGSKMVLKIGRFGSFLACSNYPDCRNTKPTEEETSDEPCDKCGSKMVLKKSRFGSFWGCSNYPDCRNIKKIENKTGIKCPKCDEGEVVIKKSKKGRNFYGCNKYPECDFLSNKKPS